MQVQILQKFNSAVSLFGIKIDAFKFSLTSLKLVTTPANQHIYIFLSLWYI